jgi:hypothetical protein
MTFKLTGAAVAAVLAISALTACGGSDNNASASGNYCDDLKSANTQLTGLDNPLQLTSDKFNQIQQSVHDLADEAPDDVKPSWNALADAFDNLESTLSDAGLSIDDLANLAKGKLPKNLTIGQAQALGKKLQSIGSPALNQAESKIKAEAKKDCNVTLTD